MAKKKPDPSQKRVLVARRSDDLDFLIGLGSSAGILSSAPADDIGIDIDDEDGDSGPLGEGGIDIAALIREAKASKVPRDLKFDDSSLPEAPNFYQWAASPDYLGYSPFLEQILIGLRLFAEYCPVCSDTEWMQIENHEPQEGVPGLLKHVVMLEHGVCPKCSGRRSDFIRTKKLKFYNELAVCAGQRCVTGNTLINTDGGLRRVGDLIGQSGEIVDEARIAVSGLNVVIDGKPCKVTHMVRQAKGEQLVRARLSNGIELEGTESHGIEGWGASYRPLGGASASPVVVQRDTLMHGIDLDAGALVRAVAPRAVCPTRSADIVKGIARVIASMSKDASGPVREFMGDSVFTDVAYRLTRGCFQNNVMTKVPDFLLSGGRALASEFAYSLDLKEGQRTTLKSVTPDVALDMQTLLVAVGLPVMREGTDLWLDRTAYDDFSALVPDVQRVCPEFNPCGWSRTELRFALQDIDHNHPLYYLRRLVYNGCSVFNAVTEITEPQHTWTFEVPCGQRYVVNGLMSENSGKSIVVALLSTYITHRVLKMQKPTRFYNVGDNQILQGTFVALTQAQAKDTLWEPYYGFLLSAPWFQRYHTLIRRYEALYGVDVMKIRDTFVLYRHRNLLVYPAGPDKRTLRGRCLVGNTLVNTGAGFLQFDEMISRRGQHRVEDMHIDSHRGRRAVSHTYSAMSKTLKAVTKNGFHVEGTPEHPMLVLTKDLRYVWRRLDKLQVGDFIVSRTRNNEPTFGTSDVTMDEATLIGYLVANGHRREISSDDPEVVARLCDVFRRMTGYIPTLIPGTVGVRADTHNLSTNWERQGLWDRIERIGYNATSAKDKEIPLEVRKAPQHVLHEFLEAYFECDSGINGGCRRVNAPSEIEVTSASKRLVEQLHVVLLHAYGILGRVAERVQYDKLNRMTGAFDAPRHSWTITITGGDAQRFLDTFKRAKVQKYRDRIRDVKAGYGSDRRNVPFVRKFIHDLYEESRLKDGSGKKLRQFVGADGVPFRSTGRPACVSMIRNRHTVTEGTSTPEFFVYDDAWDKFLPDIERICPERAARLRKLLTLGAHYEEVVSVEQCEGKKRVYDVCVPQGHAFTANGLTSHNTRVFYSIDEIGWFDNDASKNKIKTGANEVNIALERSCLTCRLVEGPLIEEGNDKAFTAYAMNVSSPSDYRDKICELLRQSQTSEKILGIHAPSWKMNPGITKASLAEEYRKNPVAAARDYGASPPVSANPFITPVVVDESMREKGRNEIVYSQQTDRRASGSVVERTSYGMISKIAPCARPSVLAIDAGETNNSFAFTCSSKDSNGRARIDIVGEIMASQTSPINFTLVFDHIILPIIRARNVKILLADRWQSNKILSDALALCDKLMQAKKYSLKYADMCDVRNMLQGGQLTFPRSTYVKSVTDILQQDLSDYPACFAGKPVEHFMYQLVTIQDARQQVVKGVGVTDDIWRSAALSVWGITNPEYALFLADDQAAKPANMDPSRLGVMGSFGAAGGRKGGASSGVVGNFAGVYKSRK